MDNNNRSKSIQRTPLWWGAFICALLMACNNRQPEKKGGAALITDSLVLQQFHERAANAIDSCLPLIQTGDLVVRKGNDFTSYGLSSLCQRSQLYSHCGIASVEDGELYIYHALGGEFNPDQKILRQPFEDFASAADNEAVGVYRYKVSTALQQVIANKARLLYTAEIPFDMDFDLQTNDRMYCAEYVYKCLLLADKGQLCCTTSKIGQFAFVGVDDLFLHPRCQPIKTIVYK